LFKAYYGFLYIDKYEKVAKLIREVIFGLEAVEDEFDEDQ